MKKFIMKLRKVSTHSCAVTLPKALVKKFVWRERQKLNVKEVGKSGKITIKDWKKKGE